MKKSKRLQPILNLAQSKEQKAAAALSEAQAQLQRQLTRLQELENYQKEYLARLRQSGAGGIAVNQLQSFNEFIRKLGQAVEQQQQAVQSARQLVQRQQQRWFASRGKVKIYHNVIDRCVDLENKEADIKEQKELDENALQRFLSEK